MLLCSCGRRMLVVSRVILERGYMSEAVFRNRLIVFLESFHSLFGLAVSKLAQVGFFANRPHQHRAQSFQSKVKRKYAHQGNSLPERKFNRRAGLVIR